MDRRKQELEKKLTEKQKKMCRAFVGLEDATCFENMQQSYIYAGYSARCANANACTEFKKKHIRDYVELLREEMRQDNLFIHRFDLKDELMKIATNTNEKTSDRLRAFELIGKMQGAFVNKTEVTTKNEAPLAEFSTEDLKQLVDNVVPMKKAEGE